jgi:MSHA pilin protein MshD
MRGFTLAELVLLITVLAIGLAGIVSVYTTIVAGSADPLVRKQAIAIAESMMDEIMLQAYTDPGTPPGASRSTFDSVTDYVGYNTTGVQDLTGGAVPGLGSYNVAVTVGAEGPINGANPARLIGVTVTGPGVSFTLQSYKVSYP